MEYGRTRKRNAEGQVAPTRRAASEILRIEAPDLRIVPDDARELHWVIGTEGFVAKGDARKVRTE